MARQEQIFAQTITDMKRAMMRSQDGSESDDTIDKSTNRGNKLKRKAKFVEEGRLDLANTVHAHRKKINYNGFVREIISKNPIRVDPDGDVVGEEDEYSGAELENLDEDPYSDVKIETLLMPLTSAGELKEHPTLSLPYKSRVLDEMIQNAQDMLFREEDSLWRIKRLANEFRGDTGWMPCGTFEMPNDLSLLRVGDASGSVANSVIADGEGVMKKTNGWDSTSSAQLMSDLEAAANNGAKQQSIPGVSVVDMEPLSRRSISPHATRRNVAMTDGDSTSVVSAETDLEKRSSDQAGLDVSRDDENAGSSANAIENRTNGTLSLPSLKREEAPDDTQMKGDDERQDLSTSPQLQVNGEDDREENGVDEEGGADEDEASHPPHRMTTRAKAQAVNSTNENSPDRDLSTSGTIQFVHPFFVPPESAISAKEEGLPYDEADETRRLVCAFVQKQEEVCRGAARLYNGLLRAKKMRDDVLEWCQAEAHIGEMSDGEDWYDKERWGLTEDLKKGEDFDEEEANVTGKKTRHRRSARDA